MVKIRIISSGFETSLVASARQWRCQGTRTRVMILASGWVYFLEEHRYKMKASEKDVSAPLGQPQQEQSNQGSRPESTKETAMTHVQQQTLLKQQQKLKWPSHRWPQMPLHRYLNCSWRVLASPLPAYWRSSGDHSALGRSTGPWSHKLFFQGIILCWRKTTS